MAEEKAPRRRRRWIMLAVVLAAGGWYFRSRRKRTAGAQAAPEPLAPVAAPDPTLRISGNSGRPNPSAVPTRRTAPPTPADSGPAASSASAPAGETGQGRTESRQAEVAAPTVDAAAPTAKVEAAAPTAKAEVAALTAKAAAPKAEAAVTKAQAGAPTAEAAAGKAEVAAPKAKAAAPKAEAAAPKAEGGAPKAETAAAPAPSPRPRPRPRPAGPDATPPMGTAPVAQPTAPAQPGNGLRNGRSGGTAADKDPARAGSQARRRPIPSRRSAAGFGPTGTDPAGPHALFTPSPVDAAPPASGAPSGPDGRAPGPEYTVKGNADSMLFHTPDSPWYRRTKAEVWFRSAEEAEAAGFSSWSRRR